MTIDTNLNNRLRRIVRKHERMQRNGVVYRVGSDGLIRSRPRLIRPYAPLKGVMLIAVLFIAFKALIFAQIGPSNYALKVDAMRNGTTIEKIGAALMQEEPVTVAVGGYLKQFFFHT